MRRKDHYAAGPGPDNKIIRSDERLDKSREDCELGQNHKHARRRGRGRKDPGQIRRRRGARFADPPDRNSEPQVACLDCRFPAGCDNETDAESLRSGPLAQWLEQRTHNPLVAGSNPAGPIRVTTVRLRAGRILSASAARQERAFLKSAMCCLACFNLVLNPQH